MKAGPLGGDRGRLGGLLSVSDQREFGVLVTDGDLRRGGPVSCCGRWGKYVGGKFVGWG